MSAVQLPCDRKERALNRCTKIVNSIQKTGLRDVVTLAKATTQGAINGCFATAGIFILKPIKAKMPLSLQAVETGKTLMGVASGTVKGFAKTAFVDNSIAITERHLRPDTHGDMFTDLSTGFLSGYVLSWGYPWFHTKRLIGGLSFATMKLVLKRAA